VTRRSACHATATHSSCRGATDGSGPSHVVVHGTAAAAVRAADRTGVQSPLVHMIVIVVVILAATAAVTATAAGLIAPARGVTAGLHKVAAHQAAGLVSGVTITRAGVTRAFDPKRTTRAVPARRRTITIPTTTSTAAGGIHPVTTLVRAIATVSRSPSPASTPSCPTSALIRVAMQQLLACVVSLCFRSGVSLLLTTIIFIILVAAAAVLAHRRPSTTPAASDTTTAKAASPPTATTTAAPACSHNRGLPSRIAVIILITAIVIAAVATTAATARVVRIGATGICVVQVLSGASTVLAGTTLGRPLAASAPHVKVSSQRLQRRHRRLDGAPCAAAANAGACCLADSSRLASCRLVIIMIGSSAR